MKKIEMVVCGNILEQYFIEAKLKEYRDQPTLKKSNIGPYFKGYDIGAQRLHNGYPNQDIASGIQCEHRHILDMDVRIYRPIERNDSLPCIVYIHGGGFTAGSVDAVENSCKRLAQLSSSCVISLDYGLAPQYPFPKAIHQCKNVLYHLYDHCESYRINKANIALCGDSAGGNIALSVAQLDAVAKRCISYLMLYYPVVNQCIEAQKTWSYDVYEGKRNTYTDTCIASLMGCEQMFQDCYLQGHNDKDPLVSPFYLQSLKGLPPMMFIIAEFDYLRVSQTAFFEKFKDEHEIEMLCYAGVNHAFLDKLGVFPQADDSLQRIAKKWKHRYEEVL